jgi:hypothetical protein
MAKVTIARSDVTSEEVVGALRRGLGPRYHVVPGTGINTSRTTTSAGPDQPDVILVATGSNRVFRAEVVIARHSAQALIEVRPGGLPGTWPGGLKLINRLGVARKAHQVLQAASGLK